MAVKYTHPQFQLTEEEILNIKQFVRQPMCRVVVKLLQQLLFDEAQKFLDSPAEKSKEAELLKLMRLKATKHVVDHIVIEFRNYYDAPNVEQAEEMDPLKELWN